ncbi:MAG: hypothetical protein K8R59_08945, partial [Thermoanaerobaculales bacterium]|nr:hypothetical protein [Thermoanaerobaculales bacterium]
FSWLRFIATLGRRRAIQKAGASNKPTLGGPINEPARSSRERAARATLDRRRAIQKAGVQEYRLTPLSANH